MALSPMMQQYFAVKEKNPDTLLFFRVGDFYEMFFDDALCASQLLELTLTGKDCGLEERAPMCGVPFHAVDSYVSRLVEKGYKVAICEQLEDPALAKGLVDRDVIRIITPGTITDAGATGEKKNNFLCAVYLSGKKCGAAWCDVSTGEFYCEQLSSQPQAVSAFLHSVNPAELLVNDSAALSALSPVACQDYPETAFRPAAAKDVLMRHFRVSSLLPLGLDQSMSAAVSAAGAVMKYLEDTQKNALSHIAAIRIVSPGDTMPLDQATRRNLELTESLRERTVRGSLLSVLDFTVTAMGARLLRSWIEHPLTDRGRIIARLDAVEALLRAPVPSEGIRQALTEVYDMERLVGKLSYHSLNARDCLALARSLNKAPEILQLLSETNPEALRFITENIDPCAELASLLTRAISPDAPLVITEGNIIRSGYSPELDELREASVHGREWLSELENRERNETGIKNLRIQYNKVFGYYIEVTKSNYSLVPERYRRKQTLTNSERFTTPELTELEARLSSTADQAVKLENRLFEEIRGEIEKQIGRLQKTALGYKTLDALLSLSKAASENHYARPEIAADGELSISDGRHPVVEKKLQDGFVPNDTLMDNASRRMHIITGPNMAGKSTYMRQVALIVLMAHMGSFVPAAAARIPMTDCVYTRVGASDDLASGQSTFMVEMSEMAYILRSATASSLVILDEIGRGTSTFDGLSIAWATVEYLCDPKKSGAKTLFATHYHELSELEGHLDGVVNFCVAVKEVGEEVLFLRKIRPGGADKSFGVYVARLAGVPKSVIARAHEIEARLEVREGAQGSIGQNIITAGKKMQRQQIDMTNYQQVELIEEIRALDVMAMTPMDALNKLYVLKEKALRL